MQSRGTFPRSRCRKRRVRLPCSAGSPAQHSHICGLQGTPIALSSSSSHRPVQAPAGKMECGVCRYMVAEGPDALYVCFMGTKQRRDLIVNANLVQQPLWSMDAAARDEVLHNPP